MNKELVRIRVVDVPHDIDGAPYRDELGKELRVHKTPFLIKAHGDPHPRSYKPGEVFELQSSVAESELRILGPRPNSGGAAPIIEPESDFLARKAKKEEKDAAEASDRDWFKRKMDENNVQIEQNQKLREKLRERDDDLARAHLREVDARAEVPTDVQTQLAGILERLKRTEEENSALRLRLESASAPVPQVKAEGMPEAEPKAEPTPSAQPSLSQARTPRR